MNSNQSRRAFIKKGTTICVACGALAACPGLRAMSNFMNDEIPDPKKLEYCGYACPKDCPMYLATLNNDTAAKKAAFDQWEFAGRYGVEFDAEKVFCYRCKAEDKPIGIAARYCDVRNCAIEKGLDCCIECGELAECSKGVFTRYPEFHKSVVGMRKKYLAG